MSVSENCSDRDLVVALEGCPYKVEVLEPNGKVFVSGYYFGQSCGDTILTDTFLEKKELPEDGAGVAHVSGNMDIRVSTAGIVFHLSTK